MFPTRSCSTYGAKNGKAGRAGFDLLGHERAGSFMRAPDHHAGAMALYQIHKLVVWWSTPPEIASAVARLLRRKQLDSRDGTQVRKLAQSLADSRSVIQPSDALRAKAVQLADRFDLRAADSLQLAAALGAQIT
jgi:predicted nucleic acid-binding protein